MKSTENAPARSAIAWIPFLILITACACHSLPVYYSESVSGTKQNRQSGRKITKNLQDALLEEIELWRGTPYRFGTAERGKGTDCSGFVGFVYKKIFSIELPRQSSDMAKKGKRIPKSELRFGDLVFFENTYKGAKGASHVGIYIGDGKIAHASTTEGVTVSVLSEDYYKKHYSGSRRIIQ